MRLVRRVLARSGLLRIPEQTPPDGPVFGLRPDRRRTLVAGPFVGEFGWELMGWQGFIRKISRAYERTIVISRPSSEYLYRDFATEFLPWDPGPVHTDYYECVGGPTYQGPQFPDADRIEPGPFELMVRFARENLQEFVMLGTEQRPAADAPFDLVIHARLIPALPGSGNKHMRNWPSVNWDELVNQLPGIRIAAIGRKELAYCPAGVTDLRDSPLEEQCAVLHHTRCCAGPSSGAMHLAALCGSPLVVWTSDAYNDMGGNTQRYLFGWNPFGVPVTVIVRGGCMAPVDVVARSILRRVRGENTIPFEIIE